MNIDIRKPNITASTAEGQLIQVKSYLAQLCEQLNWALSNVSGGQGVVFTDKANNVSVATDEVARAATFNSVKSLIIKSADIINAYYEEINKRLEGKYVAKSDYGTFTETTSQEIKANSTYIETLFTNIQELTTEVEGLSHKLIEVNAHIRSGLLYYAGENGEETDHVDGAPVYGIEVGQIDTVDGEEVFNKYARFTADRLSFYDQNGREVAYISDYKLYITHVEITGSISHGGFVTDCSDGIAIRWEGVI
jgi:hypothetical protein